MKYKLLKYCPFCYGDQVDVKVNRHPSLGYIAIAQCSFCMAQGSDCGYRDTEEDAVQQTVNNWNAVNRTGGWFYAGAELWCDTVVSIIKNVSVASIKVRKGIPRKRTILERLTSARRTTYGLYSVVKNSLVLVLNKISSSSKWYNNGNQVNQRRR